MVGNCQEIDCENTGDFECTCTPGVHLCLHHMVAHTNEPNRQHSLMILSEALKAKKAIAKEQLESIDLRLAEAFGQGRQMTQEILEKMHLVSENMSLRQKQVIELANSGRYGPDVDRQIMDIGSVTVNLGRHREFRRSIDMNFSIEDGEPEDHAFALDLNVLANSLNESNTVLIKLLEKNHLENREIIRKFKLIEAENRQQVNQPRMEELEARFKQSQDELKLKVLVLEKEAKDQRKEIDDGRNAHVQLRNEFRNEINMIKEHARELTMMNENMRQENQKSFDDVRIRLEVAPKMGAAVEHSGIYQESAETRNNIARIDYEINEIKRQLPMVAMMVEEYRKKQDLKEARENAERERLAKEREAKIKAEKEEMAKEKVNMDKHYKK